MNDGRSPDNSKEAAGANAAREADELAERRGRQLHKSWEGEAHMGLREVAIRNLDDAIKRGKWRRPRPWRARIE
jgi:hypothetical protein